MTNLHRIGIKTENKDCQNNSVKVCVAGLGTVGYPTAQHISNQGFSLCGYDVDEERIKKVRSTAFSEWSKVIASEIYVVCVSTGWKDGKPDMSNVFNVCRKISKKRKNPLVCIESTVSVGTCRRLAELFDEVSLVYVPHRYWAGDSQEHGVKQARVIGALDEASLVKAKEFYDALEIPLYPVPSLETAEMIKIAENAYRFTQIAYVEQLKLLCEENNIPFDEVRKGANTKWNINLLEACEGIGGDCLPKDIRYLASLGNSPLLRGAVEADKQYVNAIQKTKARWLEK
jgi:nucleotide sugar dehydrogenase